MAAMGVTYTSFIGEAFIMWFFALEYVFCNKSEEDRGNWFIFYLSYKAYPLSTPGVSYKPKKILNVK